MKRNDDMARIDAMTEILVIVDDHVTNSLEFVVNHSSIALTSGPINLVDVHSVQRR